MHISNIWVGGVGFGGIAIASLIFLEPLAEHFPFRTPFLQTPMYLFVDLIIIYATRRLASNI